MLEIAIIEDEEKEAAHLGAFLDRFAQETGVELRHSWYSRAADFLEHYQRAYDVVFMDIRMTGPAIWTAWRPPRNCGSWTARWC